MKIKALAFPPVGSGFIPSYTLSRRSHYGQVSVFVLESAKRKKSKFSF
nr:MAG TPA: hypothetical protein [Caudoviricetes sp.]